MNTTDHFLNVLNLIEQDGLTIYEALNHLKISRSSFYRKLNQNQKLILNQYKIANTIKGSAYRK